MTLFYIPHPPAFILFVVKTDVIKCKCVRKRTGLLREMSLKNVEAIFTPTAAEVNDNVNLMSVGSFVIR